MRDANRIDKFIDFVIPDKLCDVIDGYWGLPPQGDDAIARICVFKEQIREDWKRFPDLRFSQMLVNSWLLPNYEGFWYYKEDNEILEYFKYGG